MNMDLNAFPNKSTNAVPELTHQYESNVPGLYVIGALAGYPLIKQAMNQGYEVIEHILGRDIKPVDHGLLAKKFSGLPFGLDVEQTLEKIKNNVLFIKRFFQGCNTIFRFRIHTDRSCIHNKFG